MMANITVFKGGKFHCIERLHMMSQHSNNLVTATAGILVHIEAVHQNGRRFHGKRMHANGDYSCNFKDNTSFMNPQNKWYTASEQRTEGNRKQDTKSNI